MNETGSISPRDFLTQAEQKYGKTAGIIIKAAMVLGGAGLLYLAGPTILGLLTLATAIVGKGIILACLLGLVFTAYMFFTSPSIRAMIHDQWDGFIKSVSKGAMKINVVDRLEAYANEYLQSKLDFVKQVTDFVRGRWGHHKDQMEQMSAELKQAIDQAAFRKKRSCIDERANKWKTDPQGIEDRDEFTLLSGNIKMMRESLARFEKMDRRYELFMALLEKYGRVFDLSIRRTRSTVRILTQEYEAATDMDQVTQAMSGVMEGNDARTQLAEATMEYVASEIADKVARIDGFVDRTRSMIAQTDVSNDIAQEQLLNELSDMGNKTDEAITALESPQPSVQDLVSRVRGVSGVTAATQVSATSPSGDNKYDNLADLLKRTRKN